MLTKLDVTALRKAETVVFRKTVERSTIECSVTNPAAATNPFAPKELRHDIEVASRLDTFGKSIDRERTTAFEMIGAAQYDDAWVTLTSLFRPGDELTLNWRIGARTTEGLREVSYVGDDLQLWITRPKGRLTFNVDTSICPADSTARMVQPAYLRETPLA